MNNSDLVSQAALAWLKQQDLSDKTAVETFNLLQEAIKEISATLPQPKKSGFLS
ncbi:MAG: hypothetical protein LKF36_07805 [Lactobacillus sp.]|nr:hypothetical protein [Lactobacillus sp.]